MACITPLSVQQSVVQPKPSLAARAKEVALHYFNGFRLLVLDVRVAIRLLLKTMQGQTLTRRERKLFRRTVADMFRIVPFSVFIIIPFMEFLLPVYVYFFPNALPSTFQSSSSKVSLNSARLWKNCHCRKVTSACISNVNQCVKVNHHKKVVHVEWYRGPVTSAASVCVL